MENLKKHNNLKSKTVFDFVSDDKILKKMFPSYNGNNKHEIVESLLADSTANGFYIWSYAEYVDDETLMQAVEQQFDMNEINGFDPD